MVPRTVAWMAKLSVVCQRQRVVSWADAFLHLEAVMSSPGCQTQGPTKVPNSCKAQKHPVLPVLSISTFQEHSGHMHAPSGTAAN